MERNQLETILRDKDSTQAEKTAAQAALAETATDAPFSEQAVAMLRALGKERIEDLVHSDIEKYIARNGNRYSDPILAESANWIAPDNTWLPLLGWDERGWWNNVLDKGIAADRGDVVAHAKRKLAELEAQP